MSGKSVASIYAYVGRGVGVQVLMYTGAAVALQSWIYLVGAAGVIFSTAVIYAIMTPRWLRQSAELHRQKKRSLS